MLKLPNKHITDAKPFKPIVTDMITPLGTERGILTVFREIEKAEIARMHAPKLAGAPPVDKFGE